MFSSVEQHIDAAIEVDVEGLDDPPPSLDVSNRLERDTMGDQDPSKIIDRRAPRPSGYVGEFQSHLSMNFDVSLGMRPELACPAGFCMTMHGCGVSRRMSGQLSRVTVRGSFNGHSRPAVAL